MSPPSSVTVQLISLCQVPPPTATEYPSARSRHAVPDPEAPSDSVNVRSSLSSQSESVPTLPFHPSPKLSTSSRVQVVQYGVGSGVEGSGVEGSGVEGSGVGSSVEGSGVEGSGVGSGVGLVHVVLLCGAPPVTVSPPSSVTVQLTSLCQVPPPTATESPSVRFRHAVPDPDAPSDSANVRSSVSSQSESVPTLPFHPSPKLSTISTVQVVQYGVGSGVEGSGVEGSGVEGSGVKGSGVGLVHVVLLVGAPPITVSPPSSVAVQEISLCHVPPPTANESPSVRSKHTVPDPEAPSYRVNVKSSLSSQSESVPTLPFHPSPKLSTTS